VIARLPVTDALLVKLRGTGKPCGDGTAPDPAPQQYWVLEPNDLYPEAPSLLDPEQGMWMGFRLRSVGVDQATAQGDTNPRMDAEQLHDIGLALLLDRSVLFQGTGWRAVGRRLESSVTLAEGPTVNVVDDVSFCICAR
jgi:hypothetical protein